MNECCQRIVTQIQNARRDAESSDRDTLEGIGMLRGWLRGLHMNVVLGPGAAQGLNQDEIASALGENPRGHPRAFKVP